MHVMHITDDIYIYTSNLIFSHSPALLHGTGCKLNCSMDVNNNFVFSGIIMVHDHRHGASHKGETINKWNREQMRGALREWEETERTGIRTLSRGWVVPYATLHRRVMSAAMNQHSSYLHQSGRPTVLGQVAEAELAAHIRNLAAAGFPLTNTDETGVRTSTKRTRWLEWWASQPTTSRRSRKAKPQPRWSLSTHAAKYRHQW